MQQPSPPGNRPDQEGGALANLQGEGCIPRGLARCRHTEPIATQALVAAAVDDERDVRLGTGGQSRLRGFDAAHKNAGPGVELLGYELSEIAHPGEGREPVPAKEAGARAIAKHTPSQLERRGERPASSPKVCKTIHTQPLRSATKDMGAWPRLYLVLSFSLLQSSMFCNNSSGLLVGLPGRIWARLLPGKKTEWALRLAGGLILVFARKHSCPTPDRKLDLRHRSPIA